MLLQICVFWFIWRINVDRLFYKLFFSCFTQFWLCWVFVIAQAFLQLRQARAALQLCCVDVSLWLLVLQGTGSRVLRLQQLHRAGSVVMTMGLVGLWHVGSSRIGEQTCVSCIDKWILYHCTIREAPISLFLSLLLLLLLLLSRFSRVRLCATPQTAAHQAPRSPGFSRQEYWSGLPFPSPFFFKAYRILKKLIRIFSDLQKNCEDSPESSYVTCTHVPP